MSHKRDLQVMEEALAELESLKIKTHHFSDDKLTRIIQVSIDSINDVKFKSDIPGKMSFWERSLGQVLHRLLKLE